MNHRRPFAAWVVAAASVVLAIVGSMPSGALVSAQEQPGITLEPARLQLTLPRGEKTQAGTVMVKNTYSQRLNFAASIRGVQQGSDGTLVPDINGQDVPLKDNLQVTPAAFTLDAGQAINLRLDIIDSAQLAPGGQYAALLVTQVPERAGSVQLTPAIAASVFVVKEEGAVRQLTAALRSTNGSLIRMPSQADVTFTNTGNVPVVPRAVIRVLDPAGRTVAQGVGNQESLTVVPGKDSTLRVPLQTVGSSWRPGMYQVQVLYRHQDSDDTAELVQRAFVVPPRFALAAAAGALVIAAGVVAVVRLLRRVRARRRTASRTQRAPVVPKSAVPAAPRAASHKMRTTDGIAKRPAAAPKNTDSAQ